jgi:hypothetical protein
MPPEESSATIVKRPDKAKTKEALSLLGKGRLRDR